MPRVGKRPRKLFGCAYQSSKNCSPLTVLVEHVTKQSETQESRTLLDVTNWQIRDTVVGPVYMAPNGAALLPLGKLEEIFYTVSTLSKSKFLLLGFENQHKKKKTEKIVPKLSATEARTCKSCKHTTCTEVPRPNQLSYRQSRKILG